MRIEEALVTHLRGVPGVTNLVGTRIYPVKAPQDLREAYMVYDSIAGEDEIAHDGVAGLRRSRLSYSCCAPTYAQAKSVAEAVRVALAGFSGVLSGTTVRVYEVFEDVDLYDDELTLYVTVVDVGMYWTG
jgi:hypothetical protein